MAKKAKRIACDECRRMINGGHWYFVPEGYGGKTFRVGVKLKQGVKKYRMCAGHRDNYLAVPGKSRWPFCHLI